MWGGMGRCLHLGELHRGRAARGLVGVAHDVGRVAEDRVRGHQQVRVLGEGQGLGLGSGLGVRVGVGRGGEGGVGVGCGCGCAAGLVARELHDVRAHVAVGVLVVAVAREQLGDGVKG